MSNGTFNRLLLLPQRVIFCRKTASSILVLVTILIGRVENMRLAIKQLFFWLVLGFVTLLTLEAISRVAFTYIFDQSYSSYVDFDSASDNVQAEEVLETVPWYLQTQIVHPYFGSVLPNPSLAPNKFARGRATNEISIALFGGSVALGVRNYLLKQLRQRLEQEGVSAPVQLNLFAAGGLKQPQQLMQINYALSVGYQFDVVINLDGYNEAVLAIKDNYERGVSPFFPRLWDLRLLGYASQQSPWNTEFDELRTEHAYWLNFAKASWVKRLASLGLPIALLVKMKELEIVTANIQLRESKTPNTLEHKGPQLPEISRDELYWMISEQWLQSSLMMNHLGTLHRYQYVHLLQPNQYLEGSKPLSDTELSEAIDVTSPRGKLVNSIYARMQTKGTKAKAQGLNFVDLTQLFSTEQRTLYRDVCCHLNSLGNELLAEAVVETVLPLILENSKYKPNKP